MKIFFVVGFVIAARVSIAGTSQRNDEYWFHPEAYSEYDEYMFRRQVSAALEVTKKVLDSTRHAATPADVPHRYDDKYALAEVRFLISR